MGEVWLAEDPRLHRRIAIKTLPFQAESTCFWLSVLNIQTQDWSQADIVGGSVLGWMAETLSHSTFIG